MRAAKQAVGDRPQWEHYRGSPPACASPSPPWCPRPDIATWRLHESEQAVAREVLQSISPAIDDALDARHGMMNPPQVMGASTYYAQD